jgi:3-hydroxyisobutyrate dehydrogenase
MQRIALLGLGTMGMGMAANWLAKGFALSVWNRTAAKAEPLAARGAKVATTPREAALDADFVFAMVADDAASRGIWLGPDGALAGAKIGAIAVESSTLTPGWVGELAAHARKKGCGFLDAPVGGSRAAAASGALVFFIGGDEATLEAARPALAAVGGKINALGPVGAGATWKLINNQLIAAQTAALAQATNLARKAGFKPEQISDLILNGAGASPIVKAKLTSMLDRHFDQTDFALRLMLKDARYAVELARTVDVASDMTVAAEAVFARAEAKGLGEKDFAAVAAA